MEDAGKLGYFIEADLIYPSPRHDEQNDLTFAPDRSIIDDKELSSFDQDLLKEVDDTDQTKHSDITLVHSEKELKRLKPTFYARNILNYSLVAV